MFHTLRAAQSGPAGHTVECFRSPLWLTLTFQSAPALLLQTPLYHCVYCFGCSRSLIVRRVLVSGRGLRCQLQRTGDGRPETLSLTKRTVAESVVAPRVACLHLCGGVIMEVVKW